MNIQDCNSEKEIYFELYKRFTRILNFLYDNKLVQANQEAQRISGEFLLIKQKPEELTKLVVTNISDIVTHVKSGAVIQAYFGTRDLLQIIEEKMNLNAKN